MARSAIRVRFVFSQRTGESSSRTSRQRFDQSFAASLVEDLAFRASEEEFLRIKQRIETSFAADARRELVHLTALYRRHIIGAGRTKSSPSGMLSYVLGPSDTDVGYDDENYAIADTLPAWAPRSAKYMREKARNNWGAQWFSARGTLAKNMNAETLLNAFGPIRVSIKRNIRGSSGRIPKLLNAGGDGHAHINVATVRVFAMSSITPAMLSGLRSEHPLDVKISDRGNPGLWQLMHDRISPAFASSVSGFSSANAPGGRKYRPTLEPFLTFYLTRSIPNALALRLQEGQLKQGRRFNG